MWASLIQFATSSVAGLVATLLVVASLVGGGAYFQHRIDANATSKLEASYQAAQTKAVTAAAARQKAMDDNALSASNAETATQRRLAASAQAQFTYLKSHPVVTACIPLGLVRMLGAGGLGVAPSDLALPAGKSDSSCSTLTSNNLAQIIVGSYGRARANAEQLDALNALLRQQKIAEKQ